MKVVYLHGLQSKPTGEKIDWLKNNFSDVLAPKINYLNKNSFNNIYKKVKEFKPDLIIGSSVGGFFGYYIANSIGVNTILFNPALHSRSIKIDVDKSGNKKVTHNLILGKNDTVINSTKTKKLIRNLRGNFKIFDFNGEHGIRTDTFKDIIKKVLNMNENRKRINSFTEFINEKEKLKWSDSDAPDANGRFRDLSPKDLAKWLIKTRKGDMKKISGSLSQQVAFNKKSDPEYTEKMEKTRKEVYKQMRRDDLLKESSIQESIDGLLQDVEDDGSVFDIDIDMEDENGNTLDDDNEETGDYPDEQSRPPRIKKKQRKANAVKATVTRKMLGPDSKLRPIINKIFKKIELEVKKEAVKQKVPVNKINLDKLSIKR